MILFYRDFELGRIDYEDTDPKTTERMRLLAGQYGQRIYQFDAVIAEALGMDIEGYDGVEAKGRIQHDNGYALAISEDFLKTVQNEAKDFGL